jgi:peptidoglycan/xylan/chitin deacetylase (PgdA/CDA1 family)
MLSRRLALAAVALVATLLLVRGATGQRPHPLRVTAAGVPGDREPLAVPPDASDAPEVQGREVQLLRAAAPTPPRPRVAVLEFHVVLPAAQIAAQGLGRNDDVISVEQFGALLRWLRDHDCHVVGLAAVRAVLAGQPVPPRAVVLTFDDGYASSYDYVFPLLKAYGDPAVLFPVGAWVLGAGGQRAPSRLPFLTPAEIREMAASGLVDVQAHTWDLHGMTPRGASLLLVGPEARRADLAHDRDAVSAVTGKPVYAFAYPFGASSPAVARDLAATGFQLAFSGLGAPVEQGDAPLFLPRIFVHPGVWPGFLERYLSGAR